MSSTRQRALQILVDRLGGISTEAGYQTDAGEFLFIGESPTLGPDDGDAAIVMDVAADEPGHQAEKVVVTLPVGVQALAKADAETPWAVIEAVIADIKAAVETDHDLGGTLLPRGLERGQTEPLEREDGSEFVGAKVTYRLTFTEGWGAP